MDFVLLVSRLQFAMTAFFHFVFVPLTLGLSTLSAIMLTLQRALLHRAGRGLGRGPGAGAGGLARTGRRALLPGHRSGSDGPQATPALREPGSEPAGHGGRAVR